MGSGWGRGACDGACGDDCNEVRGRSGGGARFKSVLSREDDASGLADGRGSSFCFDSGSLLVEAPTSLIVAARLPKVFSGICAFLFVLRHWALQKFGP
jgi:hypothetical protein